MFIFKSCQRSFNPCCDGLVSKTAVLSATRSKTWKCFNPCCDGLVSKTEHDVTFHGRNFDVSILVVMDWCRRQAAMPEQLPALPGVSILVVMDWCRRPEYMFTADASNNKFQSLL